ncbi:unnamed protein product [Fraxinus pennsylvanica]|uniref:Uncharacterized protein n=1 Tax=Fraxinus pennsylvanica TaxID=56036 RepID=A0AAD1YSW9_9LAMI|nr:unnamed protein product [Fraxinus pennsylvanica]
MGVDIKALLDSGANQNLVSSNEARRLGLKFAKEPGWIKMVDQPTRPLLGIARGVPMKMGTWIGTIDVNIVPMKDYKMMIDLDFMERVLPFSLTDDGCIQFRSGEKEHKDAVEHIPVNTN